MKVIIAGTRGFSDFNLLESVCNSVLAGLGKIEVVNGDGPGDGDAPGADQCGRRYAQKLGLTEHLFPPNWQAFGRSAGPRRNRQMAEVADMLIAFWDGKSRGTLNMIKEAKKRNLIIRVFRYDLSRFDTELQNG